MPELPEQGCPLPDTIGAYHTLWHVPVDHAHESPSSRDLAMTTSAAFAVA